ncbi:MAG: CPXCG motif-containing cysteine-rich protein [Pseudoxanthomonas sp.]
MREGTAPAKGADWQPSYPSIRLGIAMLPLESIQCPYCGETIDLVVDDSVDRQQYVEDCHVCCRPINIAVAVEEDGTIAVQAWAENDA